MVLVGANIVSHMGDYPSHAHSEKERKEKAGETLIARTTLVAEEPPCCKNNQKVSKIRTHLQDTTRNQINDTFLFQNRVKVKVVGEVSEK